MKNDDRYRKNLKEGMNTEHKSFAFWGNNPVEKIPDNIQVHRWNRDEAKYYIIKNINAMSNSGGGVLIIGFKDAGSNEDLTASGLWESQPNYIYDWANQNNVSNLIEEYLDGEIFVKVLFPYVDANDTKKIIEIKIPGLSDGVTSFKRSFKKGDKYIGRGTTYQRTNNGTKVMSGNQILMRKENFGFTYKIQKEAYTKQRIIQFLFRNIFYNYDWSEGSWRKFFDWSWKCCYKRCRWRGYCSRCTC